MPDEAETFVAAQTQNDSQCDMVRIVERNNLDLTQNGLLFRRTLVNAGCDAIPVLIVNLKGFKQKLL